jgi:hypothetical protein
MEQWDDFTFESYLLIHWSKREINEWKKYNELYLIKIHAKPMAAKTPQEMRAIQERKFTIFYKSTQQLAAAIGLAKFGRESLYIRGPKKDKSIFFIFLFSLNFFFVFISNI